VLVKVCVVCQSERDLSFSPPPLTNLHQTNEAQDYNVTKQTEYQRQHYAEIAAMAAEASSLATPQVLQVIDSASFRKSIASIEMFQNASAG